MNLASLIKEGVYRKRLVLYNTNLTEYSDDEKSFERERETMTMMILSLAVKRALLPLSLLVAIRSRKTHESQRKQPNK